MKREETLYAAAQLLDRQIVDRDGVRCGKVDDLELAETNDGKLQVVAVLTGPGALMNRLGYGRLGYWLRGFARREHEGPLDDSGCIPLNRISEIGDHLVTDLAAGDLSTSMGERWVKDHVINHIPGGKGADS